MNIRLKTTNEIEHLLTELQSGLRFSTKAAVMRLAIGLSLKQKGDPRINKNNELIEYDKIEKSGLDYMRFTIFGSEESMFKLMIGQHINSKLYDEDFFPGLTFAHLDRGIKILSSEFRYAKNRDQFFRNLLKINEDIK